MMEVSELQRQIYLEGRKRYEAAHGKTIAEMDAELARKVQLASSPSSSAAAQANSRAARVSKIKAIYKSYRAGHPEVKEPTPQPAEPAPEPGPQMQQALRFAAALRLAKQNQIGEASSPTGSHKLLPHIEYG